MVILLTILSSATAVLSFLAAVLALFSRKKINEIHLLVNSRLDQTLEEIADLKKQRDRLQENNGD